MERCGCRGTHWCAFHAQQAAYAEGDRRAAVEPLGREIYLQPDQQQAISNKANAQQAAQAAVFAQQKAEAEAKAKIATAQGDAQAAIEQAKGEAQAIQIISEQLQKSPEYNQYQAVQKWDDKLPQVSGGNNLVSIPLPSATPAAKAS